MNIGILYIVATPIGNLEDITLRAMRILKEVDVIAAEDTRHTRKLLDRYEIDTSMTSYHDHNKEAKAPVLIDKLLDRKNVALVSDAGTPGISDPGYFLINLAISENISVVPIPGATAAIAALSISGLPTDRFVFEGFLPSKQTARKKRLKELEQEERTLIFYEAPHRIMKTMQDILDVFGDRKTVITRELTKIHEETVRGPVSSVLKQLNKGVLKGEFTIMVHGATEGTEQESISPGEYLKNLMIHRGMSKKEAVQAAARELGLPKRAVYKESLKLEK